MTRLVLTELARFFSRALLWGLACGALALALLGPYSAWQASSPPSAQDIAFAQEQVDAFEPMSPEDLETCLAEEQKYFEDFPDEKPDDFVSGCTWEPTLADYLPYRHYFDSDALGVVTGIALPLALVALVMGASFVAAEFSTGSIGNWLTFAPRRGQVYASKLTAAALGTLPTALVALAVLVGGTWAAFAVNDAMHAPANRGDGTSTVADLLQVGGRTAALVVGVALLGGALGFLLRHTAAVLGAIVGWVAVVEGYVAAMVPGLRPYLLNLNVDAWVNGGTTYWVDRCAPDPDQGNAMVCDSVTHVVSQTHGAVVLGVVGVVAVVVAWLVFRRRDVS